MSPDEATVVTEWLQRRFESDLALATERIGAAHVSALLRSPDAARLLVEEGARLENPLTGEWMARNPEGDGIECAFRQQPAPTDDEQTTLEWHYLQVASDDAWRVVPEEAARMAMAQDGPLADLHARARNAYLKDEWLTPRARIENTPTREKADLTLAARDVPVQRPRGYSLRAECHDSIRAGSAPQRQETPMLARTT